MQTPDSASSIEFNWGRSIFPIVACEFDGTNQPRNPRFLGTCFFTILEGYPLLISARHVLLDFDRNKEDPCILTRYGAKPALRLRGIISEHTRVDVAFMILDSGFFEQYKEEFCAIPISSESLSLGRDVFTLGYPNSEVVRDDFSGDKVVRIDQFFFKGYVSNILDVTSMGGTKRSYLVNFPSMLGMSGSPLLMLDRGRTACVGFIFNARTVSMKVDEKETDLAGEKVGIPVYQAHNFGLACDAEPLLEIRDLLNDVSGKPKK